MFCQLDNQKWWEKSIELDGCCYKESKTLNVETTAYVLLTLQCIGNDSECLPILKWLLNQRNDQGGFEGTQDTIVGIEALASFATKISSKNNKVDINISTSNGIKSDFTVNAENSLVLQKQQVCSHSRFQLSYAKIYVFLFLSSNSCHQTNKIFI